MLISRRIVLLAGGLLVGLFGMVIWLSGGALWLALPLIAIGVLGGLLLLVVGPSSHVRHHEPDDINGVDEERRRELIRGTSQFLAQMRYRYSIRPDSSHAADRPPFSTEVNSVRLGFVPAVVTDNTSERQGFGYVAFVHDGKRWRGPGLPCPADQSEAVRHAARCVSPLASEEETRFEGSEPRVE